MVVGGAEGQEHTTYQRGSARDALSRPAGRSDKAVSDGLSDGAGAIKLVAGIELAVQLNSPAHEPKTRARR
jgi:hypothetical protein